MKQYIYINNSLRFRIDEAPFPHTRGFFAVLQERVPVLLLNRWISRDSRILSIGEAPGTTGHMPAVRNNYDGTITEIWSEDCFNLKDRLHDIACQYIDTIALQQYQAAVTPII